MAKKNISNKNKPMKKFTKGKKSTGGRNNRGRITTRHKGGGHKRKYRQIDFVRNKKDIEGKVEAVEYDPNRSAHIARILYEDGERRYIIAPKDIKEGETVVTSDSADFEKGNRTPLKRIPVGTEVYNVEMTPGQGGQMARSAGTSLKVLANEDGYTHLKMASGEIRKILWDCYATIGQVSNPEHNTEELGKAGRARWKGRRPTVRGAAMSAYDHPQGGGEGGQQTIGGKRPKDVYGNVAKGKKTRKKKKKSNRLIIKRRKSKKDKKSKK